MATMEGCHSAARARMSASVFGDAKRSREPSLSRAAQADAFASDEVRSIPRNTGQTASRARIRFAISTADTAAL